MACKKSRAQSACLSKGSTPVIWGTYAASGGTLITACDWLHSEMFKEGSMHDGERSHVTSQQTHVWFACQVWEQRLSSRSWQGCK